GKDPAAFNSCDCGSTTPGPLAYLPSIEPSKPRAIWRPRELPMERRVLFMKASEADCLLLRAAAGRLAGLLSRVGAGSRVRAGLRAADSDSAARWAALWASISWADSRSTSVS